MPIKKKVVYGHKEFDAEYHIELEANKDSIFGTFYGEEITREAKLIYYRSNFCYLKHNDSNKTDNNNGIYFELKDYDFSFKPLFHDDQNKELIKDSSLIPPAMTGRQIFRGKFYGEVLEMERTLDIYDSRFDIMIFVKEGYEKQKPNIE